MKKALVGCLVVGLLLVVVGGGAFYWFVVRPAGTAISSFADSAKDMAATAQAEQAISNKSPFTAPADGRLTPAQVQSLVAVQSAMQAALGADLDTLKAKYDAIDAERKAKGRDANMQEVMGAYSDFSGFILKAKQAQVAALNQQNMSLAEYSWVRTQAYSALPFIDMPADAFQAPATNQSTDAAAAQAMANLPPEAKAAMEQAQQQAQAAQKAINESPEIQAGKANAQLLKPYKESLMKWAAAGWVGF
jgi:hypothetical protein